MREKAFPVLIHGHQIVRKDLESLRFVGIPQCGQYTSRYLWGFKTWCYAWDLLLHNKESSDPWMYTLAHLASISLSYSYLCERDHFVHLLVVQKGSTPNHSSTDKDWPAKIITHNTGCPFPSVNPNVRLTTKMKNMHQSSHKITQLCLQKHVIHANISKGA